jgi:nitrite reductase/ring-hydroxylating ferredoxin subunit
MPVEVGDSKFFLVKGSEGYRLLSVICPHESGEVQDEGEDVFTCDGHGYQFDKNDGVCVTRSQLRMTALLVDVRDGRLSALIRPE